MHTLYARVNNVTALLSSCMMVLLAAIALSSFIFTADPKGQLAITNVQVVPGNARRYGHRQQDFAFVNFNVSADLSPLFNWNTKQLFLYVSAEYTNKKGVTNEVVIWDRIVRRKEDAKISLAGRNKYNFRELSASFRDVPPAHYSLKYNVMPHVGVLTYGEAARTVEPVLFPAQRQLS
ncbi:hypothetical protein POSPLADRAFT_1052365 [Postia placenta MAD-698-R-SB12]|uniref:Signal peptidase subunit 3 n=1 Tax=Postia placenta MAD-698-R-SB12 TaxID=670580 RepID=A0A1X6NAU4_9APHY|nr:hypothetical protein POSPLADRAFT_1052365 [Postia placenta MAD-698-R-SB12]OSX65694.1 hypothetical protein POSPLADRAFT_1052365 [Postia placenta MAD-698-R-SB12]